MADGICDGCGEFYAVRAGEDDTDHCDGCYGWNQAIEAAAREVERLGGANRFSHASAIRALTRRTDEADEMNREGKAP